MTAGHCSLDSRYLLQTEKGTEKFGERPVLSGFGKLGTMCKRVNQLVMTSQREIKGHNIENLVCTSGALYSKFFSYGENKLESLTACVSIRLHERLHTALSWLLVVHAQDSECGPLFARTTLSFRPRDKTEREPIQGLLMKSMCRPILSDIPVSLFEE